MASGVEEAGLILVSFLLPLLVALLAMPPFIRYLRRSGMVVDDVHKVPQVKVASPIGPLLFLAALAGEAFVYFAFGSVVPLVVIAGSALAFVVGIIDDFFPLGGRTKPFLLIMAGVPVAAAAAIHSGVYDPGLAFPLLGRAGDHFTIYTVLVLAAFPVVANAFNMMDSLNGQLSGFTLLTSVALLFGVALRLAFTPDFSAVHLASVLPLVAVAVVFYVFNRYPSRGFDGDSGALMLGGMFAALAITCGVEIAAIVAIVPAILNSFYTLSSARGFVERRRMTTRPTRVEGEKLYASMERSAPTTLIRLILLSGPLGEKEIVREVLLLTSVSCLLSAVTSVLTWVA
jgi:UDP-N-acetylmuramyl pentapeptide phosphotransferase/UDP-N-acetylglucosamine-1-phosphate transferase